MFPVTRPPRPIFREDSLEGHSGHQRVLFGLGFVVPSSVAAGMGPFRQGRPLTLVVRGPSQSTPAAAPLSASTPRSSPCVVHHHAIQRPSRPPSRLCDRAHGAQRHGLGNPVDSCAAMTPYDGASSACRPETSKQFRVGSFSSSPISLPSVVPGLLLRCVAPSRVSRLR